MEQYIVSARKYRPATFKSVVGQNSLTTTLKNAIDSKRLAQAYLFCGPRGVGKTSCARIFAKTINCLSPTADGEACNECESCRAFNENRSYNIVELDAASNNSVEDIRNLTDQVRIPPQLGDYRVFIIDEVHMLSLAAFNAFLKTLEEPPKYVIFILATTEKHKVIPTILSRCQIYDFNRITINDIVNHLAYVASQEGIAAEPTALNVIAQKADGAMRDALSIFDQVAASSLNNITYRSAIDNLNVLDYEYHFRLVDAFLAGDVKESLMIYKEIRDNGFDSLFFVNGLSNHIRDLMVSTDPKTLPLLEVSEEVAHNYVEQSCKIEPKWFYKAMELCSSCDLNYRTTSNKQFLVELMLIKLCQISGNTEPVSNPINTQPLQKISQQSVPQSTDNNRSQPAPQSSASVVNNSVATPAQRPVGQAPNVQRVTHARTPAVTTVKRPVTMRINAYNSEKQSTNNEGNSPVQNFRNEQFSADKLSAVWKDFAEQNRDLHLLKNTMLSNSLQPVEGGNLAYRVAVDNPAQKQAFEAVMPKLLAFIRNGINNDSFMLEIVINDKDDRPRYLTQAELLKKIINENEKLATVIADFDMELA